VKSAVQPRQRKAISELIEAVKRGDSTLAERIVDGNPALVNLVSPVGERPVLTAIYYCANEIAEMFINRGAQLDIFEATALRKAGLVAEHLRGDSRLAMAFCQAGWTPVHLAAWFGFEDVARLMLDYGGSANARPRNTLQYTPLHCAVMGGQPGMIALLTAHGAAPDSPDWEGNTSLHLAAQENSVECAASLIANGASLDARRKDTATPLRAAMLAGSASAAQLLRQHGACL
jgi:ankyrin repeat protein